MQEFESRMADLADRFGTPLYVYDADLIAERFRLLDRLMGAEFGVSYAVKANPNIALLRSIRPHVATFDVSSYKEIERVVAAGCPPEKITFSGPAKRDAELRGALARGIGELVVESVAEARRADRLAQQLGVRQAILIRFNPTTGPKHFGVSFSGRASQFGIDEEEIDAAVAEIASLSNLDLIGFHVYSGTNSLNPEAIAENFGIFIGIFRQAAAAAGLAPKKLVFGSGFGVSYGGTEPLLDVDAVARLSLPMIRALKREAGFENAQCVLEMGRWLVGPAGWLLTTVVAEKSTRGVEMRLCDAGFNNHLAACGMMGTIIRRNWRISNVSNPLGALAAYTLAGPLCTSIDVLATDISLPEVRVNDVLAVYNSGAYGLTASPTRFISHPEPGEVILTGDQVVDATESASNHWDDIDASGAPRSSPAAARLR